MSGAISILTPSRNQGAFIQRCLDSVRGQHADSVEHVVVDACSADNTVDLLQQSATRWVSEPDEGQADALNKALAMSTGDIIGWINADEYYEPGIFDAVRRAFARHPDAVVVYGHVRRVLPDGTPIRVNRQQRFDYDVCRIQTPIIINCGAFFQRERLEAVGGFDPSLHYVMDWDLYIRLMRGGQRWVRLNRILGNFTMHEQSKTATRQDGFYAELHRLRAREFPGMTGEAIEAERQKQVRRMMRHMLLDGVLFEKAYFKLVRQRKFERYFGDPGARLPVVSRVLDWVLPSQ